MPESTVPHPSPTDLAALRSAALEQLLGFLTPVDRDAARRSGQQLHELLTERGKDPGVVLVGFGGGKDSSYTVAFVRAMQLLIAQRHGRLFLLRAATNWHAGMPRAVMHNIDRTYRALAMDTDPACQLLLIEGCAAHTFRSDAPRSEEVTARNRADILMTGHRTHADGRPTFCNACNLSVANSFGIAAAHGAGADVIITGDSAQEQRAYTAWISRLSRQVPRSERAHRADGFPQVLGALDDVAHSYFRDIHGKGAQSRDAAHSVWSNTPPGLRFFSIYGETAYDAGSHWNLLTQHLGFVFDELAFNFTESDCANPALMAHLRGLKCQYLFGRDYREGLREYVDFALRLMSRKDFPQRLIDQMARRYAAKDAHVRLRERVNAFAQEAYGLSERQLVCMVHSPFAAEGAGLRRYLQGQAPHLVRHEQSMRTMLARCAGGRSEGEPDGTLASELESLSGLQLHQLQVLYAGDLQPALVQDILRGDPHKERIRTRHSPEGPGITETLSGR
ncbi:PqqD family protein [Streptomyces sp. NPDC051214]|uniref:PqqD family protein n=1 Tax=Streptomyces sp. NPDC051214 TaxID=3155282 RepID=UPI00342D2D5C